MCKKIAVRRTNKFVLIVIPDHGFRVYFPSEACFCFHIKLCSAYGKSPDTLNKKLKHLMGNNVPKTNSFLRLF